MGLPKTATFNGAKWSLLLDRIVDGYCDAPEFADGKREFYVDPRLTGRLRLERLIHEGVHACNPSLPEKAVEITGRDIARLLWRLGYRETE